LFEGGALVASALLQRLSEKAEENEIVELSEQLELAAR
jgi:hypothetical protein